MCTCRASTSLAPLYSPCASSAFGWGSKPNSRSAPAPVESSPGPRTHCPFNRVFILETAGLHFEPYGSKSRSRGTMHRAGVVLLWSSRAIHSRAARCTLGHVTHFTSRRSCAVGPLHPRSSSSSAPCLFSCGKWIRAVSYVCQYSNMSSHMITLAHPCRSIAAR